MAKLLFLCTGNSCRSQMADGIARVLEADRLEAHWAGIETHGLNPHAVRGIAEGVVDISGQQSIHIDELRHNRFDWMVTFCEYAAEQRPVLPGPARVAHRAFDDPPKLARGSASKEEARSDYRRVPTRSAPMPRPCPRDWRRYRRACSRAFAPAGRRSDVQAVQDCGVEEGTAFESGIGDLMRGFHP